MSKAIMQQALNVLRRVGEYGDIYRYKNTEQSPYTQIYEAIDALNVELAKPEQEPVCTKIETNQFQSFQVSNQDAEKLKSLPVGTKLYTAPLRKPWVGLTDDEIHSLWLSNHSATEPSPFSRVIEAKLKELNT